MLKVARALVPLFRLYSSWWGLPAIIALGIMSSLSEGIGIGLFIPFLKNVVQNNNDLNTGKWFVDSLGQLFQNIPADYRLFIMAFCIFGSILLKASLSYGNLVLFHRLNARIIHRLRSGIFEQLLTVSFRFLESTPSGRIHNALSNETWRTSEALECLVKFITTSCTLIVYTILLLLISWKLTLLAALGMLLITIVAQFITRRVDSLGRKATQASAKAVIRQVEGVEGMKVIRSFGRESYEQERFDRASDQASKSIMMLSNLREAIHPIYEILAGSLLVFILFSTLQNPGSLSAFLVFIFVLYRLQPLAKTLGEYRSSIISFKAAVEEVISLLDRTDKSYIPSGKILYQGLKKGITFDRVTFRYNPSERPALEEVSICIPSNKTTALVGPSGGGKSTLINLILRLYEVEEGKIYIDNCALRELDLASWRRRVAVVSQDVYIFNTTVRENIAYGCLEATEGEIIAAAKQAEAHEFIRQLPKGYHTIVGDRGVRLSGGQKQRITLARAIVRNPDILILDEATNALDSISEHLIQQTLDVLSQNRTVIVIAHRLSTIRRANHIVVLEKGHVLEQGDFQQLLDFGGLFAELYKLQYLKRSVLDNQMYF